MVASLDEPHLETSHPKQKNTKNFRVKDLKALHARTIKTLKTLVIDLYTEFMDLHFRKNKTWMVKKQNMLLKGPGLSPCSTCFL